jgi:death-on-curing protein
VKKINYITLDEILAIHEDLVDRYGGSHGIRELGLIESAIGRPQSTFGGEDLYPTLFDKAASLFQSLLFNHAFVDGNKRTSIVCVARFLSKNGYELHTSQKELVAFPIKVENQHPSLDEISTWLEKNSKSV